MKYSYLLFPFLFTLACTVSGADLEQRLRDQGLVNVQSLEPSIKVELAYSTPDNFLHEDVYGNLEQCFLYPGPALKLALAQKLLKEIDPRLSLLVYDGVRPRSVQRKMWDVVTGTSLEIYVANPESGSIHNFGAAVDVTIIDENGSPLDMGTAFDFFGELAQPGLEDRFLAEGKLTQAQYANRQLLRNVMQKAGFKHISCEWWHFEAKTPRPIREMYRIVE